MSFQRIGTVRVYTKPEIDLKEATPRLEYWEWERDMGNDFKKLLIQDMERIRDRLTAWVPRPPDVISKEKFNQYFGIDPLDPNNLRSNMSLFLTSCKNVAIDYHSAIRRELLDANNSMEYLIEKFRVAEEQRYQHIHYSSATYLNEIVQMETEEFINTFSFDQVERDNAERYLCRMVHFHDLAFRSDGVISFGLRICKIEGNKDNVMNDIMERLVRLREEILYPQAKAIAKSQTDNFLDLYDSHKSYWLALHTGTSEKNREDEADIILNLVTEMEHAMYCAKEYVSSNLSNLGLSDNELAGLEWCLTGSYLNCNSIQEVCFFQVPVFRDLIKSIIERTCHESLIKFALYCFKVSVTSLVRLKSVRCVALVYWFAHLWLLTEGSKVPSNPFLEYKFQDMNYLEICSVIFNVRDEEERYRMQVAMSELQVSE